MRDAEIAAVSALLGVGLSGGVQAWIAVRTDRRNRRMGVRRVEDEMTRLSRAIEDAYWDGTLEPLARLSPAREFIANRDQLAVGTGDVVPVRWVPEGPG